MLDGPKPIGDLLASRAAPPKPKINLHTDIHEFVEETRVRWLDTYPFARWLGKCKGVPLSVLYMIRGDVEDSRPTSKAKLFFWKVDKWKKGVVPTSAVQALPK